MSVVNTLSGGGSRQIFTNISAPAPQRIQVDFVADVSSNTISKFFLISSTTVSYYVWNNVASGGTNPNIPGRTSLPVVYAANASATVIAAAMATAINAIGGSSVFSVGVSNGSIFIENQTTGAALAPPTLGNSGWTFPIVEYGSSNPAGAGTGVFYLFTTPSTPDYTYKVVINTVLPSVATTTMTATVAAPLLVGPSTPVYIPVTWTGTTSGVFGHISWVYSGFKIT